MAKPKVAFYWCASCGAARRPSWTWPRTSSRSWRPWTSSSGPWPWTSSARMWRPCRRLHHGRLHQRSHPHLRTGGDGPHAPEEGPGGGGLRLLRPHGGIPPWPIFTTKAAIMQTAYIDTASSVIPERSFPGKRPRSRGDADPAQALGAGLRPGRHHRSGLLLPGCTVPPACSWALSPRCWRKLPPRGRSWPRTTRTRHLRAEQDQAEKLTIPASIALRDRGGRREMLLAQGSSAWDPSPGAGARSDASRGTALPGCMGPVDGVTDQGAKFVSALASSSTPRGGRHSKTRRLHPGSGRHLLPLLHVRSYLKHKV